MNTILEQINSTGKAFVEFAVPMLVQSGVLIVILLLLDLALRKKVKAVFRYCIWMLVLVKLVLPTSLSSPLSLGYWFGDHLAYVAESRTSAEEVTEPEALEPALADMLHIIEPVPIEVERHTPTVPPVMPDIEPTAAEAITPPTAPVTPITWQGVVFLLWLAVVIALGLLLLQRAMFVRGLVAQAKSAGGLMNDALEYCCKCMGVKRKIGLKVSANATSPAVCGLFRPVILLPHKLAPSLGSRGLRAVLLHELAHIRRGDLWVNLAQTILQIAYFYNPLLWLANAMIRRVREQAIDETVLVAMGEKAQQYPQTLVNVAKLAFKRPVLSLRLIGVVESKSALAGRIKHILNRPMPKSAKVGVLGLAAVLIIGAVLLPMAKAEKQADMGTDVWVEGERQSSRSNLIEKLQAAIVGGDISKVEKLIGEGVSVNMPGKESTIGWVVDGRDRGIARVVMEFSQWDAKEKKRRNRQTIRTREDGSFVMPLILIGPGEHGSFTNITAPGFDTRESVNVERGIDGTFYPDGLKIKLYRLVSIAGRVYGINGKPLAGAPLSLSTTVQYPSQGEWTSNHLRAITDEQGHFRMEDVPPGTHLLYYPWSGPSKGEVSSGRWRAFHGPDERWPSAPVKGVCAAKVIKLGDGRELRGIVIDLSKSTCAVEGQVHDTHGRVVADAMVSLYWVHSSGWGFVNGKGYPPVATDAEGRYRLQNLPPGDWHIKTWHDQVKQQSKPVPIELKPGRTIQQDLALSGQPELDAPRTAVQVEVEGLEVGPAPIVRAVDNKAMLAGGLTVELLGLTEIPIKDNPWWKPNGSLIEQPPFDNVSSDPSRDPNHDQFAYYAVAMKLKGKAPDEIRLIKWNFTDALYAGTTSAYLDDKGVYKQNIRAAVAKFPKDVETTALRLGFAGGDWQTLVAGRHYGFYRKGEDSIVVRTPERAGGPFGVRPQEKGLHISVTYNITDRDFRVVAVDKDGKVHFSTRSGSSGTGNLRQTTASFPDLTRDELQEYRFQVRPHEWVEFEDISLRPGKEAVALTEKRRAAGREELEKWLGQGRTRRIREQILVLRGCRIFKEMEAWALAIRELVSIGKPAVPELLAELRRAQRWPTQSTVVFTLRAIADPRAVPVLIEVLGRVEYRGEYGIHLKDPPLSVFMLENQHRPAPDRGRKQKDPQITIGCPVIEITAALEKITGHTEGHEHYGHKAVAELGGDAPRDVINRRIQEIVREVAGRWQKWWQQNKQKTDVKVETPVEAALGWLKLVDDGDYAKSFDKMAALYRGLASKADWEKTMDFREKGFGKAVSRKVESKRRTRYLPTGPAGEYVIIEFESSFEHKSKAAETVTLMRDRDGVWRVANYFIK